MVWSVKQRAEALYLHEIEQAVKALPHVTFHLHVSEEAGFLTAQRLVELSKQSTLRAAAVFLCGPPAMMKSLGAQCRQLGLRRANLIAEEFALR